MADESKVELRGECRREIVDVIDAFSIVHGCTRMQMVNLILREWAGKRRHESMVLQRLSRGNPAAPEDSGFDPVPDFSDSQRGGL